MQGRVTESSVRYIPFKDVKEALVASAGYEDWDSCTPQEKREWVVDWINDMGWEYDSNYMNDYDITYKSVEGISEVWDTQEEWNATFAKPSDKYAVYSEVYVYHCSFYNYENPPHIADWDIQHWGKGYIADCHWFISDELMEYLA